MVDDGDARPQRRGWLYAVVILVVVGIGAALAVALLADDDDQADPSFATLPDGEFEAEVILVKPDGSRTSLVGTCSSLATSINVTASKDSDVVRFFLALIKPHEKFPPVEPAVAQINIDGQTYLPDAASAEVTDRYGRSGTLSVDGLLDADSNTTQGRYLYEWSCVAEVT